MITYDLPPLPMYDGRGRQVVQRQRVTQLANGRQRIEQMHDTVPTVERITFKVESEQVQEFEDFFNTLGGKKFCMHLCLPRGSQTYVFRFLSWGDYGELEGTVQGGAWRYSMQLELYSEPLPLVLE